MNDEITMLLKCFANSLRRHGRDDSADMVDDIANLHANATFMDQATYRSCLVELTLEDELMVRCIMGEDVSGVPAAGFYAREADLDTADYRGDYEITGFTTRRIARK